MTQPALPSPPSWSERAPRVRRTARSPFYCAADSGKPGKLSYGIAVAALAAASAINCVLGLQTLAMLLRRRVFVPDYK